MKTLVCFMVVAGCLVAGFSAAAEAGMTESSYTINNGEHVPIPDAYEFSYRIDALETADSAVNRYLNQPADIHLAKDGTLFIADSKNNRVLQITKEGKLLRLYTEADGQAFSGPQGVFCPGDGTLFIADTGNARIVRITVDGLKTVRVMGKPEASELADITVYLPQKIAFSQYGELFVLMGENIMMLDEENNFRGFIGQTKIGYSFLETLLRRIASETQKKSIQKRMASAYDNFFINADGLIYAVNRDTKEGQVKVINSVGNNIYRKVSSISSQGLSLSGYLSRFFTGNVLYKQFSYGEKVDGEDPLFVGICVDQNGIVTAVEKQSGRFYQYDQNGNLLAVFGGLGINNGQLAIPGSMTVDAQGNLYVLDVSMGSVIVLTPTAFIQTVQGAVTAYNNGDYDTAQVLYQEILSLDATYPMAHEGLADAAFKKEAYKQTLDGYRQSGARVKYSTVFTQYRYEVMKNHFGSVALVAVLVAVAVVVLLVYAARCSKRVVYALEYEKAPVDMKNGLLAAVSMLFRPRRTIDAVRGARGRIRSGSAVVVLALVFLVRILFIYTVHYPLQDIELSDVNLALEFLKLIVPVITWIIASYLITSQLNGESTLQECFVCTSYCMVPYIVVNLAAAALSHILSQNEKGLFALLVNGVTIWYIWLFIRVIHRINDYSGTRTLAVCLLTVIVMVLIWFAVLFGYSLVVRLLQFFQEILQEIRLVTD